MMLSSHILTLSRDAYFLDYFRRKYPTRLIECESVSDVITHLIKGKYDKTPNLMVFFDDSILGDANYYDLLKRLHEIDSEVLFFAYLPGLTDDLYLLYQDATSHGLIFFENRITELEMRHFMARITALFESNRFRENEKANFQQLLNRQSIQNQLFNDMFSVIKFDQWGKILDINEYCTQEMGWRISQVAGRSVFEILFWSNEAGSETSFEGFSGETRYFNAAGQQRWAHGQVAQSEENRQVVYYFVGQDITEQKQMERLQQFGNYQEGMDKAKSELIHNIGNTLNSMSATQDVLARGVSQLNDVALYVNRWLNDSAGQNSRQTPIEFISALEKGLKLILENHFSNTSDILRNDLEMLVESINSEQKSLKRKKTLTPVNLYNLIQEVVTSSEALLDEKDVGIQVLDSNTSIFLQVSRNQLFQSLLNLVMNAAEALDESAKSVRLITIQTMKTKEGGVQVVVHDSGEGISPENQEKIFAYGFTTKEFGSGQGLHSVANFMNSNNGSVEVKSSFEEGTSFILTFPPSQLCWS